MARGRTGWVDGAFTTAAQFTLHTVPASIQLGPGGDLTPAGASEPGPPARPRLKFQIPMGTDASTLSYTLGVYVFVASDPSPVADLRRVLSARILLEDESQSLASLDEPADQRPYLFIQVYPKGVLQTPLSESAVINLFAAADVLAAFLTIPAA